MQDPTLVLLAAGLSKRFGRSKQETPVGPDDEVLHDYNIYDALSSGFARIVFVVRSDNESAIRDAFEARFGYSVPTSYVRQMRPLGTGHAVAGIRGLVEGPFAVCNTDDLYGREAFSAVLEHLRQSGSGRPIQGCVVGYRLGETLSGLGILRGISRSWRFGLALLVGVFSPPAGGVAKQRTGDALALDAHTLGALQSLSRTKKPVAFGGARKCRSRSS